MLSNQLVSSVNSGSNDWLSPGVLRGTEVFKSLEFFWRNVHSHLLFLSVAEGHPVKAETHVII